MHKLAEKIADCLKAKVEGMGIDNISGQDLVELGMWTDIVKDMMCYDKDKRIVEAMEESEEAEEAMKYIEMYEDYPERKGYRGQRRDSRGRFMSNRGRRGYEFPVMMHDEDWEEMERTRDMDRPMGRMGYSGAGSQGGGQSSGGNGSMSGGSTSGGNRGYSQQSEGGQYSSRMQGEGRDSREGRSGQSRRGYMEAKEMNKDKNEKMKELDSYTRELGSDISEMIEGASPEEKTMLKQKLQGLISKIN